jgi:hypothetical protein
MLAAELYGHDVAPGHGCALALALALATALHARTSAAPASDLRSGLVDLRGVIDAKNTAKAAAERCSR